MGTHYVLMDHLEEFEKFLDGKVNKVSPIDPGLFYLPTGPVIPGGKTLNFVRMGRCLYWLYAMFFGTDNQKMEADHLLLNDLQYEKLNGHMSGQGTTEQMCADPHYNFWVYCIVLCYQASKKLNRQLDMQAFSEWICRNFTIEAACS